MSLLYLTSSLQLNLTTAGLHTGDHNGAAYPPTTQLE